jgi:hypothetical protein
MVSYLKQQKEKPGSPGVVWYSLALGDPGFCQSLAKNLT